jgi:uncharacterized SAM-binding protein YcdF (DUF218 family)
VLFFVSKVLWLFLVPSTLLLILALLGLALLFGRWRRAGLACLTGSLGAIALIGFLPVGDLMLAPLENRFPEVTALPAGVAGIIVLGGAIETDLSAARGMPSLNEAAERMTSLAYLARHYPQARLAFTGGNGEMIHAPMTEAAVARALFTQLGVDQSRIVYESRSRTTYENAVLLKALVQPRPGEVWLLVTSAWHMPRSVGLFRHAGWTVLPYPVGYKTAPSLMTEIHGGVPDHLAMVDLATHEWVGLAAYWLLGRTSALFPAPQGTTPR